MNEETLDFIDENFEDLNLSDEMKQLVAMFIEDISKHENVSLNDITFAGGGKTSSNIKIGEYILKVGRVRRTKEFRNSSRILQPVIRREIEMSDGDKMFIEVQNEVNAEWYKEEKNEIFEVMYQVYKDIRDEGLIWSDINFKNIGKLLKDNKVNYTTSVHDKNGNKVDSEIIPDESATGLKGKPKKVLKAGDYVLLDTDFVFDVNDLPDGRKIKDMLLPIYYNNYELRYQREKREREENSR